MGAAGLAGQLQPGLERKGRKPCPSVVRCFATEKRGLDLSHTVRTHLAVIYSGFRRRDAPAAGL